MRKLLNTLYVSNPDAYLHRDGENIVISVNSEEVMRIPALNLEGIVCFSRRGASHQLLSLCCLKGIGVCFMTPEGRFMARVSGPTTGNVFLRKNQYALSEDIDARLSLDKIIVAGKIFNSRKIVERFIRDHVKTEDLKVELSRVSMLLDWGRRKAISAISEDALRGLEGEAAMNYFSVFDHFIVSQKDYFHFRGRNRRPPKDPVNAMLSFVYMLLTHEVQSALETVGLDPYVGFFHTLRPGRASLALDMVEEFRGYLGDRLVLSLINRRQVNDRDFVYSGDNNVVMTDSCRKLILSEWQKRKKEEIRHPYLDIKIPVGLLPYVQAKLMAQYIRGDIDSYPVFLIT